MKKPALFCRPLARLVMWLGGGLLAAPWGHAATVLSGNVSGTWTLSGSPYILSADCTVASNQTLTIQPGVTVTILPDVSLRVGGGIFAVGTPEQPIAFAGASPSKYWDRIQISNSLVTSRFTYCKFSEGTYGLHLYVDANRTVVTEILNNTFKNFISYCIWGQAETPGAGSAILAPQIHNNIFENFGSGCEFLNYSSGRAFMNPVITANIFRNSRPGFPYRALGLWTTVYNTNKSSPIIANNVIARCGIGLLIESSNFVPIVRNNIFFANDNAFDAYNVATHEVEAEVKYNSLFQNGLNFDGFADTFGLPVIANNNGTPCDVFYNIFVDPKFTDTNTYRLAINSPCIDAGDPAILDACFAFSRGTTVSDIGAYGGLDACGWLTNGFAPIITGSLSGQSSCAGQSAKFTVGVVGTAPLDYRWFFNTNTVLAGETNAQLNLANLQTNQAGFYSVAVSNTFGSVTSAPARLLVFDACTSISLYAGLSITGMVGRTYVVDASTNIAGPTWMPFATNTLTTPRWLVVDTNTPLNPARFFRVRLLP